jgi:hypothetical protein
VRTPSMLDRILAPQGAAAPTPLPLGIGSADVYRESWFTRLLEIELRRAREPGPDEGGREARLIVGGAELLSVGPRGEVGEGDVVGEIGSSGPGRYAILTNKAAGARAEGTSVAQWIAAASGSGV